MRLHEWMAARWPPRPGVCAPADEAQRQKRFSKHKEITMIQTQTAPVAADATGLLDLVDLSGIGAKSTKTKLFGEVIYAYTLQDALADG